MSPQIPSWQRASSSTSAAEQVPMKQPESQASSSDDKNKDDGKATHSIESVRKFLDDPIVKNAPVDQQRSFLESKGVGKDLIDEALRGTVAAEEGEKEATATIFDPAEFKTSSIQYQTRPQTTQTPTRDVPPIVTYPEFLIQPQKPPPLVTVSRLVNTAYVAGGLAATFYGLSKYLVNPMREQLTEARHDYFSHVQAKLDALNEKLARTVSHVPETSPKKRSDDTEEHSDEESVVSDPTELFHRDIGTQTSRRPSLVSSSDSSADANGLSKPKPPPVERQQEMLRIISSHLKELAEVSSANGTATGSALDSVEELRMSLYELATPITEGVWTPTGAGAGAQKKKDDDAIAELRAEIRGVKGLLLNARRFPTSTVPARPGIRAA